RRSLRACPTRRSSDLRRHARTDLRAVAPTAILDRARRQHGECERAQLIGLRKTVQRQLRAAWPTRQHIEPLTRAMRGAELVVDEDRKSTRLNSSHVKI